jgi:hypothetical protein
VELTRENIHRNESLLPTQHVHATTLDWVDPHIPEELVTLANGTPFDVIIFSDVFYDEDIVEPLLHSLRRLCVLRARAIASQGTTRADHLQPSRANFPRIYMSASHRTDRLENMFFDMASKYFVFREITATASIRKELHREFISIWTGSVREDVTIEALAGDLAITSQGSAPQNQEVVSEHESRRECDTGLQEEGRTDGEPIALDSDCGISMKLVLGAGGDSRLGNDTDAVQGTPEYTSSALNLGQKQENGPIRAAGVGVDLGSHAVKSTPKSASLVFNLCQNQQTGQNDENLDLSVSGRKIVDLEDLD